MKGADIGQAAGITNMVRQIGGAAGIAGLNIFLTDRGAVHNNALLSNVNIYDPATQDRLAGMTHNFLGSGYSMDQAQAMAYRLLDLTVWKQYNLIAYNDVFLLVGVLTLACLPLVFFVKYKKPKVGVKVVMAHE
jgi:DHA2 family multidrug resistance protein